jgi:3'-phosphoadenosine 5'-phosphosulfate sulfotransferase (PAPS reductase)/FAD synthetase
MVDDDGMEVCQRHVLGISGGKDSAALAVFMRDRVPQMEYFFCDTGAELPETYEYLLKLESFLGKPITRLNSGRPFEHWMEVYRGTLPSPQVRWCTRAMKLKPLEDWLGDDTAVSYVALRADEDRDGYISTRENITSVFPFREHGIDMESVRRILDDAGLGLPSYYEWRTRSGCYFCFFQRKSEWVRLAERHPDLFEKAVALEQKVGHEATKMKGRAYTWSQGESLEELLARRDAILAGDAAARGKRAPSNRLLGILADEDADGPCLVCDL